MTESKEEQFRLAGNEALKAGDLDEAVLNYDAAIKISPKNHTLYSNRSLAHLKQGRFAEALNDAKITIELNPKWIKGYFRAGEVYAETENYADAIQAYRIGSSIDPTDQTIKQRLAVTDDMLHEQVTQAQMIPYFCVVGMVLIGLTILFLDSTIEVTEAFGPEPGKGPMLQSLVARFLVLGASGAIGWGIGQGANWWIRNRRKSYLDPTLVQHRGSAAGATAATDDSGKNIGTATGSKRRIFRKVPKKPDVAKKKSE